MEEFKLMHKEVSQPSAIKCDICGTTYFYNGSAKDILETQEFLKINFVGGYNSVFGDMGRIRCDICQHCLKRMIGKYCRIIEVEKEENANLYL